MKLWIDKGVWLNKRAKKKADKLQFDTIKSIAVIKHAALGDLLMTRALLAECRLHFPNAILTLGLISHYTNGAPVDMVDKVHVTYGSDKKKTVKQKTQNFKEFGYHDLVIDISATPRSFWLCALNKAKFRIGFIHKGIHKLLFDVAVPRTVYKLEAETFLDTLCVLGINYQWPLNFALPSNNQIIKQDYIVIFPTASDKYKCWPSLSFVNLIKRMINEKLPYKIILLEGLADWEKIICKDILKKLNHPDTIILQQGGDETTSIIEHAQLVICNDTGIRNMAIAYHTATVGIFMSTLPYRYYPRFDQHSIVFDHNGLAPSVDNVFKAIVQTLPM